MKIICLECHRALGEKFPFDDPSETHSICPECVQKVLKDSGRERQS